MSRRLNISIMFFIIILVLFLFLFYSLKMKPKKELYSIESVNIKSSKEETISSDNFLEGDTSDISKYEKKECLLEIKEEGGYTYFNDIYIEDVLLMEDSSVVSFNEFKKDIKLDTKVTFFYIDKVPYIVYKGVTDLKIGYVKGVLHDNSIEIDTLGIIPFKTVILNNAVSNIGYYLFELKNNPILYKEEGGYIYIWKIK